MALKFRRACKIAGLLKANPEHERLQVAHVEALRVTYS